MAADGHDLFRRDDPRRRLVEDLARRERRGRGGHFFSSLALIGAVGWPIAALGTGGALLGRYLDGRFGSGIRLTLTLLALGVTVGTWAALQALRRAP